MYRHLSDDRPLLLVVYNHILPHEKHLHVQVAPLPLRHGAAVHRHDKCRRDPHHLLVHPQLHPQTQRKSSSETAPFFSRFDPCNYRRFSSEEINIRMILWEDSSCVNKIATQILTQTSTRRITSRTHHMWNANITYFAVAPHR